MAKKVEWGILSAAAIARKRAVPGMLQCELAERDHPATADVAIHRASDSLTELLSYRDIASFVRVAP